MIHLFKADNMAIYQAKDNPEFDQYGDMILQPSECTVELELNGTYKVTLVHPKDSLGRWKYLEEDAVLSVPVKWSDHNQLFRIYDKETDLTSRTVYAMHLFFDLAGYTLIDTRPTDKNGEAALKQALQGTPFTGHSDITKISTAYWVRLPVTTVLCGDDDNCFMSRWGGERYYDNFDVHINEQIGDDYGISIQYGRNMAKLTEKKSMEDVVTRIIPVGFDGIMLDGDSPWVDSPLIDKYASRHDREIVFDDIKVDADDPEAFATLEAAQEEMIRRCEELYEGGIDKPTASYTAEMVNLSKTNEYQNLKELETVLIGDTVTVVHQDLDIDLKARCVALKYNALSDKIESITLNTEEKSYFQQTGDIQSKVEAILNSNGTVNGGMIKGVIDAMEASLRLQSTAAQKVNGRVFLIEEKDENSDLFGAIEAGTQGFRISKKRSEDNRSWVWTTALTAAGLIADIIVAGILSDRQGKSFWNLDTGELQLSGIFRQLDSVNGYKSVDILDNGINIYDFETNGDYIGSIRAIHQDGSQRRTLGLYCDHDNITVLGVKESDGKIRPVIQFDATTPDKTPYIKNTVNVTLFPSNPYGGITVENGLIKKVDMKSISGNLSVGQNATNKTLVVANGLIVDVIEE